MIRRYLISGSIAFVVVVADLVTKRLAAINFRDGGLILIPQVLAFDFMENPGAAFSLFRNAGPFLGVAAIVVSILILFALRKPRPTIEVVALGLVLGGALGNLFDRIFRGSGLLDGKVIDWVVLGPIPTFNIADASVTTAVGLLLLHAWLRR